MVSKKNTAFQLKSTSQKRHYGLRKLSVGVASVLLSTTFYLGMNTIISRADTTVSSDNQTVSSISSTVDNGEQQETPQNSISSTFNQEEAGVSIKQTTEDTQLPIPAPTNSLNSTVGQSDQINVDSHEVKGISGNLENPGVTNLELGMTISKEEVAKLQAGDYIDIKLGLPYDAAGQQYVMSYGAVNNQQEPIIIPYKTSDGKQITAAYIVPAGELTTYQQETYDKKNTVTNLNDQNSSLGTSNGYYQIIFTDGIKNYLAMHIGQANQWYFKFNLNWYNGSQFQENKENVPFDFPLYTVGEATTYTPNNDLQVGDYTTGSGLSFKVEHIDLQDAVKLASETILIDHTGNVPAHTWFKRDGIWYASVENAEAAQGVGLSLSTQDEDHHELGNQFTITVTKPADNDDVTFKFVGAESVREQLQDLIVGYGTSSVLTDQVVGEQYSISHQSTTNKPKVKVTASQNGDTISYLVTIDGAYQGFRVNSGDNQSNITLISWKPKDPAALLPREGIKRPGSKTDNGEDTDYGNVMYADPKNDKWLGGYPIRNQAVSSYLNSHPWTAKIFNDSGYNFDSKQGYWIDMATINKPRNNGYVNSQFYGFVDQVIHYVDDKGNQMVKADGEAIPDTQRQVIFTSENDGFSGQTNVFTDIVVSTIEGYTAYAGVKDDSGKIKIENGKAVTIGEPIIKYGAESSFGYPHAPFIEYVVYVKSNIKQETETFTATETITYKYANGPRNGEQAADPYTKKIVYSRSRTINQTTNQVIDGWSKWVPTTQGDKFVDVTSPTINAYHLADKNEAVISAPQLPESDYQNGQTKTFTYEVDYVMDETPTPEPKDGSVTIYYVDLGLDPQGTTFQPNDGTILTAHTQSYAGVEGTTYQNTLWNYQAAGYELATSIVDPLAENGILTDGHQDVYVYLKHKATDETQLFTATEKIIYKYTNGPHKGEQAADPYTKEIIYSRSRTLDQTTGQPITDWSAWLPITPNDQFADVTSPTITGYHLADENQAVISAPRLTESDYQNAQTKVFNYEVDYLMDEAPTPDPKPEPKPNPEPDPKPKPKPNPKPDSKPEPIPTPNPEPTPVTPDIPTQPMTPGEEMTDMVHGDGNFNEPTEKAQQELPQTGNYNSEKSAWALAIAAIIASFGLAGKNRKNI
ncbi:YSIRK-type signal peptide-containing protein [Lactobacillaceae bacterium 24-114]